MFTEHNGSATRNNQEKLTLPRAYFDPAKKGHRQAYAEFTKTGEWPRSNQEKLTPYLTEARFNHHVDEAMLSLFFYKTTKTSVLPRVYFDPAKKGHRQAYAEFTKTGKWPINFFIEEPHLSVPHTVLNKLALYAIRRELA